MRDQGRGDHFKVVGLKISPIQTVFSLYLAFARHLEPRKQIPAINPSPSSSEVHADTKLEEIRNVTKLMKESYCSYF